MASHRFVVKASLTAKPGTILRDIWKAVESFARRFELTLECDPTELPEFGDLPFGDGQDSHCILEDDLWLHFSLWCWAGGGDFVPDEVEELCEKLAALLATGGTVHIIDCDRTADNPDGALFRCIGPTKESAIIARVEHGMEQARDALEGVMGGKAFMQLQAMALQLAAPAIAEAKGGAA